MPTSYLVKFIHITSHVVRPQKFSNNATLPRNRKGIYIRKRRRNTGKRHVNGGSNADSSIVRVTHVQIIRKIQFEPDFVKDGAITTEKILNINLAAYLRTTSISNQIRSNGAAVNESKLLTYRLHLLSVNVTH